jgi:DNA polymerase-3 subunit delta'
MNKNINLNQLHSTKLIGLDFYFDEMIDLYKANKFPKVLLLNGKKGIGKFTLVMHFINYIFSKDEITKYNLKEKIINVNSVFYNLFLNRTTQDIIFIQAEENKNIKIEDIRSLKSTLANTSLSNKPRFVIIDEVEFLNTNSVNALLKTLEEPSDNNFFILINNQQANLIETISSRSLKNNIFLSTVKSNDVINYLVNDRVVENLLTSKSNLSPGQFFEFNKIFSKYKMNKNDNIFDLLNILISAYKKEKDKSLINLIYYLIDCSFFDKIKNNKKNIDFLLNTKSSIVKIIHNFVQFNINIASVLNSIKVKLNNV